MTTPRQIVDLQLRAARDISKREVSASTLLVIPYGELKMLLQDTADQAFEAGQKSESGKDANTTLHHSMSESGRAAGTLRVRGDGELYYSNKVKRVSPMCTCLRCEIEL